MHMQKGQKDLQTTDSPAGQFYLVVTLESGQTTSKPLVHCLKVCLVIYLVYIESINTSSIYI